MRRVVAGHTCYNASGVDYYGTASVAASGNLCLRWNTVMTAGAQLQMTGAGPPTLLPRDGASLLPDINYSKTYASVHELVRRHSRTHPDRFSNTNLLINYNFQFRSLATVVHHSSVSELYFFPAILTVEPPNPDFQVKYFSYLITPQTFFISS